MSKPKMTPEQLAEMNARRKKMRAKVIHYLCLMGYTKPSKDNTKMVPDYVRINAFIQEIGSRNPKGKILNYLYENELRDVLVQVEAMYRKELGRFNKAGHDA